jgi:hypothetical protein
MQFRNPCLSNNILEAHVQYTRAMSSKQNMLEKSLCSLCLRVSLVQPLRSFSYFQENFVCPPPPQTS